jgi:pentatricopeptide repeat domain-containing protein 1
VAVWPDEVHIHSGAQWEKARELFELMQQQGCTPDVVTYTALISAFERGGKWHLALHVSTQLMPSALRLVLNCSVVRTQAPTSRLFCLAIPTAAECVLSIACVMLRQAFQAMQAKGCKPDSIVYNAIIDALWDTGCAWPQHQAALLYRSAPQPQHCSVSLPPGLLRKGLMLEQGCLLRATCAAAVRCCRRASAGGLLRRASHAAPGYLELCLHTLTPGVAALSLYTWLADLRWALPAFTPAGRTLSAPHFTRLPIQPRYYMWCLRETGPLVCCWAEWHVQAEQC